jgi:hypothetical protein
LCRLARASARSAALGKSDPLPHPAAHSAPPRRSNEPSHPHGSVASLHQHPALPAPPVYRFPQVASPGLVRWSAAVPMEPDRGYRRKMRAKEVTTTVVLLLIAEWTSQRLPRRSSHAVRLPAPIFAMILAAMPPPKVECFVIGLSALASRSVGVHPAVVAAVDVRMILVARDEQNHMRSSRQSRNLTARHLQQPPSDH